MLCVVSGIVRRTLLDSLALAEKPRQGRRIATGRTIGVLLVLCAMRRAVKGL